METKASVIFPSKQIKEEHKAVGDVLDRITDISTAEVTLTRRLFNLCENPHPHTYVHTHTQSNNHITCQWEPH